MTWEALLLVFATAAITVAGGLYFASDKNDRHENWLPHFISVGTGMLIALCFVEFLPHSFDGQNSWAPLLIMTGLVSVILADRYIAPHLNISKSDHCYHHEAGDHSMVSHSAACSSIGCILVCAFFDGIEIPAAFALGNKTGLLVSSGMVLHTVPEGALAASIGIAGGLSVKAIRRGVIFVGVAILAGALFNGIMGQFLDFKKVILPFTSGVLLYVSLGHLMPAALKNKFGILGICFGAALIFLLLFGHAPH